MGNAASISQNILRSGLLLTTDPITYKQMEECVEHVAKHIQQVLLRAVAVLFADTEQTVPAKEVHKVIVESIKDYVPQSADHSKGSHVSLGDVLDNFVKLKDEPRVKEQDELLGPIEESIRTFYVDGGKGTPDSAELAERVQKLHEAYAEALQRRTTKKGRIKEWLHVIREGNDSFEKVYNNVWHEVIYKKEQTGVKQYRVSVNNLRKVMPTGVGKPEQVHSDAVPLYLEAAAVKPAFDRVVRVELQARYSKLSGGKELDIRICPTLKRMTRVIEKARLKGRNSAACVKDIVRAMVTVASMDQVAIVLDVLCVLHEEGQIEVVRIKERFLESPSAGGWRDAMVNFRVLSGGNKHICELQVVHSSMLNARKGLPGHLYYGIVRNAMEMMDYCPEGAPKMYSVDMAGLLPWLPADMNEVKHKGWLREDVPLGEWDGVTTNAKQQVVGVDVPSFDKKIGDNTLKLVAHGFPNLTKIDLRGCNKITDAGLQHLAQGCPNLANIILGGCRNITDAGLQHLAQGCPNLASIDLGGCRNITDAGLQHLTQGCPNLTDINLRGCLNITDAGLQHIAQGCRNLTEINLGGCDKITDAGLQHIAQGCPNLTEINLGGCDKITDAGLQHLAQGCPNLTDINLYYCEITDAGLQYLAQGCPNLTDISLVHCYKITDAGLQRLAQGCPNLANIKLGGCDKITDAGLQHLAQGCPNLTDINLGRCRNITDAGVEHLKRGCPKIKIRY